jgi:Zn-dependent alcohol dehydrogenase
MGHEANGIVEAVGADDRTLEQGDLVVTGSSASAASVGSLAGQ